MMRRGRKVDIMKRGEGGGEREKRERDRLKYDKEEMEGER